MNWCPWTRAEDYPSEPQPAPTIDDQVWRDLQGRAMKAHPELADTFSPESVERRHAASQQYERRRMN
jgi:hypothetical protein